MDGCRGPEWCARPFAASSWGTRGCCVVRAVALLAVVLSTAHLFSLAEATAHAASPPGLAAAVKVTARSQPPSHRQPFNVFGYLPEYRQQGFPYADTFSRGLTHLIFFSLEVDPQSGRLLHASERLPHGEAWSAVRSAADAADVKLLVCVGGGGRSAGFSRLVASAAARRLFLDELNTLVLEKGLDGVDFNWEYPQSVEEWQGFAKLLREARSVLGYARLWNEDEDEDSSAAASDASSDHRSTEALMQRWRRQRKAHQERRPLTRSRRVQLRQMVLTMAVHPTPQIAPLLRSLRIMHVIDYLFWMAYDYIARGKPHASVDYAAFVLSQQFIGALDESQENAGAVGTEARLGAAKVGGPDRRGRFDRARTSQQVMVAEEEAAAAATTGENARKEPPHTRSVALQDVAASLRALGAVRAAGARDYRQKLALGIPFYGRHATNWHQEPETYEHLQLFVHQWARKRHPDWRVDGSGEEMKRLNTYAGYYFDSFRDVQAKMRLARALPLHTHAGAATGDTARGIAGIMIWELGQDLRPASKEPLSLMNAIAEQLRGFQDDDVDDTADGAAGLSASLAPPKDSIHTRGEQRSASADDSSPSPSKQRHRRHTVDEHRQDAAADGDAADL